MLPGLPVGGPGLQGHPSGVQTLGPEQLADVGGHHDVDAAVGAHVLPTHTHTGDEKTSDHHHLCTSCSRPSTPGPAATCRWVPAR